jgi:hypothetical protein
MVLLLVEEKLKEEEEVKLLEDMVVVVVVVLLVCLGWMFEVRCCVVNGESKWLLGFVLFCALEKPV